MDKVRICQDCNYAVRRRGWFQRWRDAWDRRRCPARGPQAILGHRPRRRSGQLPGFVGSMASGGPDLARNAKGIVRGASVAPPRSRSLERRSDGTSWFDDFAEEVF